MFKVSLHSAAFINSVAFELNKQHCILTNCDYAHRVRHSTSFPLTCAILISSWSAFTRNSGVTPKRPDATCLILDVAVSPFCRPLRYGKDADLPLPSASLRVVHLMGSSPPSPLLDLPPMRLTAMAMVSWVCRGQCNRL